MISWIDEDGEIEYPREEKERIEKTCQWCIYNRLFDINGYTNAMLGGEDDIEDQMIKRTYKPNSAARALLDLIYQLGRVWDYERHADMIHLVPWTIIRL